MQDKTRQSDNNTRQANNNAVQQKTRQDNN